MSNTKSFSSVALDSVLEQISVQLDGTTTVVKIPVGTFNFLDTEGQSMAKSQAGSAVGHQVEFYLDSRCDNRVYLASLASITINQSCEAKVVPGFNLPVLFPTTSQKKTKSPNGFLVYRSHHSLLVKAETPGIKNGEISTILGARWKALTDEEKEPWLQLARTKAEAKRAEESVSDSDSTRPNKRRRTGQTTNKSPVENHRASQDVRGHPAQAIQYGSPFSEYQLQSPAPSMPENFEHSLSMGGQHVQSVQTGTVSDHSVHSSTYGTSTSYGTLQHMNGLPLQAREASYAPSDYSFQSSLNPTLESLRRSQPVDQQRPPSSWMGSFSDISVQSPAYNEPEKFEQSQTMAEEHTQDDDGILSPAALSVLMQDVSWDPFALDLPPANEAE
ncbi:hypothetical protein F4801DRAFT_585555 [Xylaria longipes]|nr:hypothetical protein F4801DRAFT_585555 [Xylaria longipes]